MEVETFVQLINAVGFPIAVCVILGVLLYREMNTHRADSEKWCKAISDNTNVMERLLDALTSGKKEV